MVNKMTMHFDKINQKAVELIRKFRFSTPKMFLHLTFDHDIGKMSNIHDDEYYKDELVEIYSNSGGNLEKFAKESLKHIHALVKDVQDVELQLLKQFKDDDVYRNHGKGETPYEKDRNAIINKFNRIERSIDNDLYNICLMIEQIDDRMRY